MKKRITALAALTLSCISSNSQALVLAEDEILVVANTAGAGSYYTIAPQTATEVLDGFIFSVDLSPALAALGGTIETFAVIATSVANSVSGPPVFNYDEQVYVSLETGMLFSGDFQLIKDDEPSASNLGLAIESLNSFLLGASLGLNLEGSTGDFDQQGDSTFDRSIYLYNYNGILRDALLFHEFVSASDTNPFSGTVTRNVVFEFDRRPGNRLETRTLPLPGSVWFLGAALLGGGCVKRFGSKSTADRDARH